MKFRFVAAIHNDGLAEKRRGTLTDNPRQDIRAAAWRGGNDDAQRRGLGARDGRQGQEPCPKHSAIQQALPPAR